MLSATAPQLFHTGKAFHKWEGTKRSQMPDTTGVFLPAYSTPVSVPGTGPLFFRSGRFIGGNRVTWLAALACATCGAKATPAEPTYRNGNVRRRVSSGLDKGFCSLAGGIVLQKAFTTRLFKRQVSSNSSVLSARDAAPKFELEGPGNIHRWEQETAAHTKAFATSSQAAI